MRTPLVAGNWKMNGSLSSAVELAVGIRDGAAAYHDIDVVVCPAFVHLSAVQSALGAGAGVALGAQDLSTRDSGAFTGDVSGLMLQDVGCRYVLVGHSERRALHGESDSEIADKFLKAKAMGLIPVLCVGETLEERQAGRTMAVITGQFSAVAERAGIEAFADAVVAYEPVWAIGTGETASPEQAQEVHSALRALAAKRSAKIAAGLRLLYGGSVKAANAAELFAMPDIDGGLIGGAALDADGFLMICGAAVASAA